MLKEIDELEVERDAGGNMRQEGFSLCIAKNFATIVKIPQP